jgi:hypothetical protein
LAVTRPLTSSARRGQAIDHLQFAVMAETGNREIVEKFFQAFNTGDLDRMESWMDPEYAWECRSRVSAYGE